MLSFNLISGLALVSTSVYAATFTIQVGDGGFVYTPPSVNASKGDIVSFQFTGSPGNHSVSQAAFAAPCVQLQGGFDSGFVFIPTGFKGPTPAFNLTIEDDTKPIWFYCKQTNPSPHCISGMVGAINPPTTGSTLAQFKDSATALSSLAPQSPGSLQGVGASASSPPSPLENGASLATIGNTTAPSPTSSGNSSGGSSSGSTSGSPSSSNTAPAGSNTNTPKSDASAVSIKLMSTFAIFLLTSVFTI